MATLTIRLGTVTPFSDELVVGLLRLRQAELAEVGNAAIDGDVALPAGLVVFQGRNFGLRRLAGRSHRPSPCAPVSNTTHFWPLVTAAPPGWRVLATSEVSDIYVEHARQDSNLQPSVPKTDALSN